MKRFFKFFIITFFIFFVYNFVYALNEKVEFGTCSLTDVVIVLGNCNDDGTNFIPLFNCYNS